MEAERHGCWVMRQMLCSPDLEQTPVSLHIDETEELLSAAGLGPGKSQAAKGLSP